MSRRIDLISYLKYFYYNVPVVAGSSCRLAIETTAFFAFAQLLNEFKMFYFSRGWEIVTHALLARLQ